MIHCGHDGLIANFVVETLWQSNPSQFVFCHIAKYVGALILFVL